MKKLLITPENPNGVLVDMTSEEIAKRQTEEANWETKKQELETTKQAIETNKASGNQKLLDLGLTQAEATALTGYTPPASEE
tara:strand:+ start:770 stop:1015 length:246 start_codon:yes stop_codon:yes gene_type:complete